MGRELRGRDRQNQVKERQEIARKERVKKRRATNTARKQKSKESRAEYFKERRQKMRNDLEQYEVIKAKERARYHRRVAEGKIRKVDQMTDREKRQVRKRRRGYAQKHQEKKKAERAGQPSNIPKHVTRSGKSYQSKSASKLRKIKSKETREKIESLELQLRLANKRAEKYRKKLQRSANHGKGDQATPRTRVRRLVHSHPVGQVVRKKLFENEVVCDQLKSATSKLKADKEKQTYSKLIGKVILKKYKMMDKSTYVISKRMRRWCAPANSTPLAFHRQKTAKAQQTLEVVSEFYEDDMNSVLSPGKKEFAGKKQKVRYMTDSLVGLYEKFCKCSPVKISFSQFCRLRPRHVMKPHVSARHTCACSKCENSKMLVSAFHKAGVIEPKNLRELMNSLCCENKTNECLTRCCHMCQSKIIHYEMFELDSTISFEKWSRETVPSKSKKRGSEGKDCVITVKITIVESICKAVDILEESVKEYMLHLSRINHQYAVLKSLKDNLSENDLVLHVDFSENYSCKYAVEVQGVHFGGSRPSVTLHTGIAYTAESKTSFCSLSDCERHDPSSIMAHITPMLEHFLEKSPCITNLHLISDGPTSQYRCKNYFQLLTTYIPSRFPQILDIAHNYSEAGHGKGGPDGVGGVLKNIADDAAAHGADVSNFEAFCAVVERNVKSILIKKVDEQAISAIDAFINKKLKTFPGTLKVHQLKWTKEEKNVVLFSSLSCYKCQGACAHYGMGSWKMP